MLNRRFLGVLALALAAVSLTLILPGSRLHLSDNISRWRRPDISVSCSRPNTTEAAVTLPPEYYATPHTDDACSRFSSTYFDEFHAHAASYCEPGSRANLTCFHRQSGFDGKTDSFCFGQAAVLDVDEGKFQLDCSLRQFSQQEEMDGLLPLDRLPGYWYETGPAYVFSQAVDVKKSALQPPMDEQDMEEEKSQETSQSLGQDTDSEVAPPKRLVLLKREGEGNPWHSLMEVFSTYMTFDILRMPRGDFGENAPFFSDPDDADDTQVIILDDRDDGPYFDLWTLFARRKPLRFHELLGDRSIVDNLKDVDLIVPLAGSSNPFWKDDERAQQCNNAPMLNVFSRRVLDFYGIQDPPVRKGDQPIVVTFVKRRDTRRIQNQRHLFAELQRRNSHIKVQMIDFAAIPFSEQVRIARETDVLVGVHGAGLTQSLFMRQGAGAVVEIQPEDLDHNGFRNVAGMRGLGYYRTHARTISPEEWVEEKEEPNNLRGGNEEGEGEEEKEEEIQPQSENDQLRKTASRKNRKVRDQDGWHWSDIDIEENRFFEAVEAGIKFMYTKGPWKFDVN